MRAAKLTTAFTGASYPAVLRSDAMRALGIAVVIAACAPQLDSPIAHQRAIDRDDARALATQLTRLPGVVAADAILERPVSDALTGVSSPGGASIVLVVDSTADRPELDRLAKARVHVIAPEIPDPQVAVMPSAARPEVSRLGPFLVATRDRNALVAVLAICFALVAAATGYIMWRERR
jgi:hypothetical protein